MKNLILFTAIIFKTVFSVAQECYAKTPGDEQLKSELMHTPFIFEGVVIKSIVFYNKDVHYNRKDSVQYTSNVIKITKIFKGAIKNGTIEVITYGALRPIELEGRVIGYEPGPGRSYGVGFKGVFFCTNKNNYPSLNTDSTSNNTISLSPIHPFGKGEISYHEGNISGFGSHFNTIPEFYEFLKKQNITIPEDEEEQK